MEKSPAAPGCFSVRNRRKDNTCPVVRGLVISTRMETDRLQRILVAEDESDWQDIHRMALETMGGFTVKICSNGKEALKAAPGFKPDFLILDVMMGDMTGMQLLNELRALPDFADTPAIFLTARAQAHELEEYRSYSVAEVISKPYDPMSLAERIRGIWSAL